MTDQNEKDPIVDALEALKKDPPRDPARARQTRQHFLDQVEEISRQPVSIPWFSRLISVFRRSEPQFRLSTLTIAIFLGLLLISFSGSVVAARQALPDQFLYPYKLWLENRRLELTSGPDAQIRLRLEYAEERMEELEALGIDPDDPDYTEVLNNYQTHLDAASDLMGDHPGSGELDLEDIEDHPEETSDATEPEDDYEEDEKETETEESEDSDHQGSTTPEPEDTIEVEDSSEPQETEHPEETQQPAETETPEDTDEPDLTDTPDDTEDPDKTDEPDETEEP